MSKLVQRQAKVAKRLKDLEQFEQDLALPTPAVAAQTAQAAPSTAKASKGAKASKAAKAVQSSKPEAAARGRKRKLVKQAAPQRELLDDGKGNSNIVYLGHIPDGFEEPEIRKFFDQFGDVVDLKLTRSKKTGNSRGFGFIKFGDVETAKVAAETMNGYFVYERQLVCHVIRTENVHDGLLKPAKGPRPTRGRGRQGQGSQAKEEEEQQEEAKQAEVQTTTVSDEVRAARKEKRQQDKKRKLDAQLAELGVSLDAEPAAEELDEPPAKAARTPKKASGTPKKKAATPAPAPATPQSKAAATPARKTRASAKKQK